MAVQVVRPEKCSGTGLKAFVKRCQDTVVLLQQSAGRDSLLCAASVLLISNCVGVSQVFNYSKLGSHDEVARAVIPLRSYYRQGDQQWEQRVSMQPVAKAGKTVWGGEVLLKLRYVSPQVCWATAPVLPTAS